MKTVLLDTDILSLFLRNRPNVITAARDYLQSHSGFTFSIITQFEILRGLKVKEAKAQIEKFHLICMESTQLGLSDPIIDLAAEIYAKLYRQGQLISDADILIAATALEHGLAVITNNTAHFDRVDGLEVLNWNT